MIMVDSIEERKASFINDMHALLTKHNVKLEQELMVIEDMEPGESFDYYYFWFGAGIGALSLSEMWKILKGNSTVIEEK